MKDNELKEMNRSTIYVLLCAILVITIITLGFIDSEVSKIRLADKLHSAYQQIDKLERIR